MRIGLETPFLKRSYRIKTFQFLRTIYMQIQYVIELKVFLKIEGLPKSVPNFTVEF